MTMSSTAGGPVPADARSAYSARMIALHWLMAALLAATFAAIELRVFFEKGTAMRDGLKAAHFMLGLTILALVIARLVIRLREPTPAIVPPLPGWQAMASRVTHLALYALMIAMPILGWSILSAEGKAVPFWGLTLPPLLSENKDLAHSIEEVHETLGTLFYLLIGVHTAAALFHHYIQRDNTLTRMIGRRQA